jgi:tetratricopeptide (TPR) repeat protein
VLCGILVSTVTAWAAAQQSPSRALLPPETDLERRISEAEAAASAHPSDSQILLRLVNLYDLHGDFKKSVPLLERLIVIQPHNLNPYRLLGIDRFRVGQPAQALEPLRTVLEVDPQDSEANFYLGLCYLALDRDDEAGKAFDKVAAAAPAGADELYFLVKGYSRLSSAMLGRLAALDKDSYRMHEIRGEYFDLQNAPEQALKEYQTAVQQRPDLASLRYVLGNAYWKLSRLDNAAAEFRRAIELAPQHFMAHYKLGLVLLEQNSPAEALKEFRSALSEQPGLVDGYLGLGKALYQEGQYEAAIPQLQRFAELSPSSPTPHYLLYQIFRRLNNTPEAEKQIDLFKQKDEAIRAEKGVKVQ